MPALLRHPAPATTIADRRKFSALLLVGFGLSALGAEAQPSQVNGSTDRFRQSEEERPTGRGEVTLDSLLDFADKHSPVLSIARATRSRADAARAAASPVLPANPELTVAIGPRFADSQAGIDLEASVAQRFEVGGQRGLRFEAADRLRELTEAEIEELRWSVHCDVHAMFHRAIMERERVELAQQVVLFQQEVLQVVERQISAGEAAPLTLRLAQVEVAQAQQLLVAADQGYASARIRLGQLAGWPAATPPTPTGSVDEPRDPPAYEELLKIARAKLPSLRAGAAAITEAEARAALADREGWVQPSLGAQYSRESSPGGGPTNHVVMGVLSFPIPGFRANEGGRASARADATIARAELQAETLSLSSEIAVARSEVIAAAKRTRAFGTEILPRFAENLTLLRRAFELGEIDILALSVGRERFLRIQSDSIAAQVDYFVALAALERVVGVDLWEDKHHEGATP